MSFNEGDSQQISGDQQDFMESEYDFESSEFSIGENRNNVDKGSRTIAVSYTHLTLPTTPYV